MRSVKAFFVLGFLLLPTLCTDASTLNGLKELPRSLRYEIVPHARAGESMTFALTDSPAALTLQGFSARNQRWQNLVSRKNPSAKLSQLRVPQGWLQADLRLVATYRVKDSRRDRIASIANRANRTVTFTSTPRARLFSVEYREDKNSSWARVCTVASSSNRRKVTVSLPDSVPESSEIRVMAVSGPRLPTPALKTPLSEEMRAGPTSFSPSVVAASEAPLYTYNGNGGSYSSTTVSSLQVDSKVSAPLTLQESDIWKTRGSIIYFFNRLRGLQVIDASIPAEPLMLGHLPLPGAGEEMYLLGDQSTHAKAALLVTGIPWSADLPEATRLSRVSLAGDQPVLETSLELPGYYVESRLVGDLLHIVTASWSSSAGDDWSPRTYITTIDVSQENRLVSSTPREFACMPHAVGSTEKYLWFAGPTSESWANHSIYLFPYNPDHSLAAHLSTEVGGLVQDKFKVGDVAGGFAVVVQGWRDWRQETSVKTYKENGGALVPLGELELVRGEQLFATRFERDRLYTVTFEQIDPLWIVDLSEPAKPEIKGHLEVPGWSTYIHPVGDVLVAVGRDGGKVQISLFDVSDESKPFLAARVDVGSGWSWSEAEWNEKAVKILPDAGLILIPVVEWDGAVRHSRVGLVEFDPAVRTLLMRGTIAHDFAPRRASLMDGDVIASLSNRELLLVDANDRNNPSVVSETTLAFGVDSLVVHEGAAIMFENGGHVWSGAPQNATVRTSPANDTDNVVFEMALPCSRILSAEVFGDRMVLVEGSLEDPVWSLLAKSSAVTSNTGCHVSVWSMEDPMRPALIGRAPLPFAGSDSEIVPAPDGRVLVTARGRGRNFFFKPIPVVSLTSAMVASDARVGLPWLGSGNQKLDLAVVDISGGVPAVVGTWSMAADEITAISRVFSAGDLLALSYDRRDTLRGSSADTPWPSDWSGWRTRSWLQIIDLADPTAPMPWAPVELPGELLGLSWLQRAGGVLFTRAGERVAALGFDGETAALAAELSVPSLLAVEGADIYFPTADGVSAWSFSETLQNWQRVRDWPLGSSVSIHSLHVADGALLAADWRRAWVLRENGSVSAADLPSGANLRHAAHAEGGFLFPAGEFGVVRLP